MKFKYYKELCGHTMQSLSDKTGIPKRTLDELFDDDMKNVQLKQIN